MPPRQNAAASESSRESWKREEEDYVLWKLIGTFDVNKVVLPPGRSMTAIRHIWRRISENGRKFQSDIELKQNSAAASTTTAPIAGLTSTNSTEAASSSMKKGRKRTAASVVDEDDDNGDSSNAVQVVRKRVRLTVAKIKKATDKEGDDGAGGEDLAGTSKGDESADGKDLAGIDELEE